MDVEFSIEEIAVPGGFATEAGSDEFTVIPRTTWPGAAVASISPRTTGGPTDLEDPTDELVDDTTVPARLTARGQSKP